MIRILPIISFFALILMIGCSRKPQDDKPVTSQPMKLELKNDALVLTTDVPWPAGVKQPEFKCDYYVCWVDEKTMEHRGAGAGKAIFNMGLRPEDYGRGSVCVIAITETESYISNVLKAPNKPDPSDGK